MKSKVNKDKFYISKRKLIKLKSKLAIHNLIPAILTIIIIFISIFTTYQLISRRNQTEKARSINAQQLTPGLQLYVSLSGSDANNGRSANSAFQTIDKAKNEVKTIKNSQGIPSGGIAVNIASGSYENLSLTFDNSDSGTDTSPIIYRANLGQQVRLFAGQKVPASALIGTNIKQISLSSIGIGSTNPIGGRNSGYDGSAPTELYFNDKRMTIAQYPNNSTWAYTTGSPNTITNGYTNYKCGDTYDCNVIDSLEGTSGLFVHAWTSDYSSLYEPAKVDPSSKKISASGAWIEMSGERRFKMLNAKSLLDSPGEYFIDQSTNTLYFYPPETLSNQEIYLSTKESLFKFNNASNIRLERLTMEIGFGNLVDIQSSNNIQVLGSTLKNSGKNAVWISGGADNLIQSNDMHDLGEGGVIVSDGTSINILNNHIYKFEQMQMSYRQAIKLIGSNNRAAYNKINDAPNMATWMQGKNNIFEYNEISDVVKESGDTAPFHSAAISDTTGNDFRYNYLHDIDSNNFRNSRGQTPCEGTTGIYLDNNTSDFRVFGNILYNTGVRGIFVNNGSRNRIENNIMIGEQYGVYLQWRYWNNNNLPPKNNSIQNNISYNVEVPLTPPNKSAECPNASWQPDMFTDNVISNANGGAALSTDPGIIDTSTHKLIAGTSQSITQAIPNFKKIPIECIGNYNDEYRNDTTRVGVCGEGGNTTRLEPLPSPVNPNTSTQSLLPPISIPRSSTPYTELSAPGVIQSEFFDNGGQNVAYYDTTSGSQLANQTFRNDTNVDIETKSDGYSVSWAVAGEYLKYTVNFEMPGIYKFLTAVASQGQGGTFQYQIDNNIYSNVIQVPDTKGWQSYTEISSNPISLASGTHTITLRMLSNGTQLLSQPAVGNFDYINIQPNLAPLSTPIIIQTLKPSPTLSSTATPIPTPTTTPVVQTPTPNRTSVPTPSQIVLSPLPQTDSTIGKLQIYAAAQPALGVWPQIGITIIGQATGDVLNIVSRDLKPYVYTPRADVSLSQLQFSFINDYYENRTDAYGNIIRRIDRNVRIQKVVVNGREFYSTDPSTYSRGTWAPPNGCATEGYLQTEWLRCQWGYFRFDQR